MFQKAVLYFLIISYSLTLHCKKSFSIFPSPAGMSLTKFSLGGNNDVITELFLPRGSLVSDIPAGDGELVNLFFRCTGGKLRPILTTPAVNMPPLLTSPFIASPSPAPTSLPAGAAQALVIKHGQVRHKSSCRPTHKGPTQAFEDRHVQVQQKHSTGWCLKWQTDTSMDTGKHRLLQNRAFRGSTGCLRTLAGSTVCCRFDSKLPWAAHAAEV